MTIADWITTAKPRKHIKYRFTKFLTTFIDEHGKAVYAERLRSMCEANEESFLLSYAHLSALEPALAYFLANSPKSILPIFDETAHEVVLSVFNDYNRIKTSTKIRIIDIPGVESLRDLR